MSNRVSEKQLRAALATYCEVAGIPCTYDTDGEPLRPDDYRSHWAASAYHLDHAPVYGGTVVVHYCNGSGTSDTREFGATRLPRPVVMRMIRAATSALYVQRERANA